MDVAMALSVAQTLLGTLKCSEVRKLCSILNYESELKKLLITVETIKNILLDAGSKCQELTNEGRYWVENLKNVVYDADDLLDEYKTIAQKLNGMPGGKLSKKVRRFFSSKNQLLFAYKTSAEVNKLREKLDSLAKNQRDFGFSELYKPVKSREETCSYVYEQDIIGRDADKNTIVDILLQHDFEMSNSFVTIVGVGGLGKNALAQLVFNDHRVRAVFQKKYWVCVSENFDMKDILAKMIAAKDVEFEDLQKNVRNQIEGKRYLLVLDDVWPENGRKWVELRHFFISGERGSKILVTSRSLKVARAVGNYPIHKLQGLSKEDSWNLFKKISLGQRVDDDTTGFVEIGKDIVGKCANTPLSIRVVSSLLRGQDITVWQSYRRIDLAKMRDDEDDLMQTLLFSYYHLEPALKCFAICSVFPQDYEIDKEELISLWSAHGYLAPTDIDSSMEDVGERYFSILLHRCFFQDIKQTAFGGVESVKMHDLMHDLARKIAGKDSLTLTASSTHKVEGKVRHLFIDDSNEHLGSWLSSSNNTSRTLRTCLNKFYIQMSVVDAIISKCSCLRVLDLRYSLSNKSLPDTLGRLLHLRYLDLSYNNNLEMLPKSITKLHNLKILKLRSCKNLKELPKDISKLVNLSVLDIYRCKSLTQMPAGLGKLMCLHTLSMFVVRGDDEIKQDTKDKLVDLTALISKFRGDLYVIHYANPDDVPFSGHMNVKLKSLKLRCELDSYHKGQEILLESLFFHQFQELRMQYYGGTKLPISLASGLVSIKLYSKELQYLPSSISQLCHLKYLKLKSMESMEYVESDAPSPSAKFFPSLAILKLAEMPKLKGWWKDITGMEREAVFIPSFPQLSEIDMFYCDRLTYIPPCPVIKVLHLVDVNEGLAFCEKAGSVQSNLNYLNKLKINNSCVFNSLSMQFVGSAVSIKLIDIEIREGLQSCASSIQDLEIYDCSGLENLRIEHLTNLESLTLESNIQGIPWKSLHSLSSLKINKLSAANLPKGIKYLTSLQSLFLMFCNNLEDFGESLNSP